ncbi:hypothetical protein H8356DRAFT_1429080 [Neocallimastix lanati (nom. inval.)]|nr:hypothetical protein H8356DRAFT_1429080 [Neocallimastix sp. JGI-2020a]
MQKYYDFKLRKHPKNPLRNAAHGDKRENRARNAVELRRFVEIKFNELQNCDDYIYDDSVLNFYKYSEACFDQLNDQKHMMIN